MANPNNNWLTIKSGDIVSGAQGTCYANIDGNVEAMLYVKNVDAKAEKVKTEIPVLGSPGKKHKSLGWSGTGTMTAYYATSLFRQMMIKYIKTGVDTYFDLIVENEDPTGVIGKQTVLLKKVNIDSISLAKLDIESTELDEEMPFTFEDADMLNGFTQLVGE